MTATADGDAAATTDDAQPRPVRRGAPTRPATLPLVTGLVATAVALWQSWTPSLWSDEVATISAARRSWTDLGRLLADIDAVHGAYYALVHVWTAVAGTSAVAVRPPSALAVGAAAALTAVLARRLAGSATGWAAGLVLAGMPRVTWAGAEARPFALTIALAAATTFALTVAVAGRGRRLWALYGLLAALAVLVNVYLVLLLAAHAVTVALVARDRWRPFGLSAATAVVLTAPLLWVVRGQGGQLGVADRSPVVLARGLLVDQWFLGETPTPTTGGAVAVLTGPAGDDLWKPAAVLLAVLAVAVAAWGLRPDDDADTRRSLAAWALPWALVPSVTLLGASLVVPSLYNPRYLTFTAPAVALLVARGVVRTPRGPTVAVVAALVVLAAPVYASQRTPHAKNGADLTQVAELLDGRVQPGDGVYFGPRDEFRGPTVRRSLRTVELAHPATFAGTVDVTLVESPARGATLFGTSAPLATRVDRLADLRTLWVVRRLDRPDDAAQEDALLAQDGWHVSSTWNGTQTQVVELHR